MEDVNGTAVPELAENGNELTLGTSVAYAAIITMAVVPIYIGSYWSLSIFKDLASKGQKVEKMTHKDAYMFPVMGSCVLFGLYVLFKLFSKEYVNYLLTAYFLIFGIGALTMTFSPVLAPFFPKSFRKEDYKVTFPFSYIPLAGMEDEVVDFSVVDFVAAFVGVLTSIWYIVTKHWIANNVLGLSFSLQGIAMLNLGSYKVGCILLWGLFVYDIFWVFGTDVMVTVARSFDAPVKLLFPKDIFQAEWEFSMLGLGDIVIPGIFIALLLRFDYHLTGEQGLRPRFFNCTMVSYFLGLATTIFIMHTFNAAQPALLYLVPYCVGASAIVAICTGNLQTMLNFEEEGEGDDDNIDKKDQ